MPELINTFEPGMNSLLWLLQQQQARPFLKQRYQMGQQDIEGNALALAARRQALQDEQALRGDLAKNAAIQSNPNMVNIPAGEVNIGGQNVTMPEVSAGELPEKVMLRTAQRTGNIELYERANKLIDFKASRYVELGSPEAAASYLNKVTGSDFKFIPGKGDLMTFANGDGTHVIYNVRNHDWQTIGEEKPQIVGPGGTLFKGGQPVYTAPERKIQPTEAGLAERAAGGDQTAEAALKRLERSKLASRPTINLMTGNDAKDIADAIEAGNQPPDTKGLYRNAAPVRAELARRKYNLTHANLDWQAVQRQIATLNGPQQTRLRQSIETASELTDSIEQTYNDLQKVAPSYGYKLLNHYNLGLMKNLPGDAGALAQKLETQIADLTADIANVYMGGNSPTDHGLALGAKNLSGEWNPETFKRAIETLRTNITIRRNSILLTQPIGPGGQSAMPGGETVRPSAAPMAGAGGKVSVNVPGKGSVWFPNQAAADEFKRETGIP